MSKALTIKMGCDPELFVKSKIDGKFVSAHDLLPGTKDKPFPVKCGAIQVDGVAAEFNIEPALTAFAWVSFISQVLAQLKERLPDHTLEIVPAVTFDPNYFYTLPETTRELGCNMDYNAWTGQPNDPPDGVSTTMRTASGHIHIGWTEDMDPRDPEHIEDCCMIVKQLDYYLGVPSLLWDNDPRRRLLYGKAGAFRPKPYGLEYRTLSNRWLTNVPLQQWVYSSALTALQYMISGQNRAADKYNDLAQDIINKNQHDFVNSDEFRSIWGTFNMNWPVW